MTTTTWYWECTTGSSNKFYTLTANNETLDITMNFGRIGTAGQVKHKGFTSRSAFRNAILDIKDKRDIHGYVLVFTNTVDNDASSPYFVDISAMEAVS